MDMPEQNDGSFPSSVPFRTEGSRRVGESRKTLVIQPERTDAVVKVRKVGEEPDNQSELQARALIRESEGRREELTQMLKDLGTQNTKLPKMQPVIYGEESEKARVAYVQVPIEKQQFLSEMGTGVLALPETTLQDLRKVFQLQLSLSEEGRKLDIVGTAPEGTNPFRKVVRHVLPIFNADNLAIVDNSLVVTDSDPISDINDNIYDRTFQQLDAIGSRISTGIIDVSLKFKSVKERVFPPKITQGDLKKL